MNIASKATRFAFAVLIGASAAMSAGAVNMDKIKSKAADAASKAMPIDPASSSLAWTGKKVTGQHNGTVMLKGGQVALAGGALTGGEFEIDMATIKVDDIKDPETNAKLAGHLKSDDFFGVEKFPTAKFKITKVSPMKGGTSSHQITGDLTIKGITHPVTFPATVSVADGKAEAKGTVTVDRTKYDVRYGSGKFFENLGDKTIYDDFTVELNIVAAMPAKK